MSLRLKFHRILIFGFFCFQFAILFFDSDIYSASRELFHTGIFLWIVGSIVSLLLNRRKWSAADYLAERLLVGASILFIVYSYSQGLNHLPESSIAHQRNYIRFFFYLTLLFILFREGRFGGKIVWFTLASCAFLPLLWGTTVSGPKFGLMLLYILATMPITRVHSITLGLLFLGLFALYSFLVIPFGANLSEALNGFFIYSSIFFLSLRVSISSKADQSVLMRSLGFYFFGSVFLYLLFYAILPSEARHGLSLGSFPVNSVGSFLIFAYPASLYFWNSGRKIIRFSSIFLFLIVLILLYFTHTRSAYLSLFLVSLFFLFTLYKNHRINQSIYYATLILIFMVTGSFLALRVDTKGVKSFQIRMAIWEKYLEHTISRSPIIGFGHGSQFLLSVQQDESEERDSQNLFSFERAKSLITPHAHNVYVQIFYEYGLIGILLFAFSIVYYMRFLKWNWVGPRSRLSYFLALGIFAFMFQELFDYTIPDPDIVLLISAYIGMLEMSAMKFKKFKIPKESIIPVVMFLIVILPIWILSQNGKLRILYQKYFTLDNFMELDMREIPDAETLRKAEKLKDLSLGIFLGEKPALLYGIGQFLSAAESGRREAFLDAKHAFEICIRLNPKNSKCHYLLAELHEFAPEIISKMESEQYRQTADTLNPDGLVHSKTVGPWISRTHD